MPGFTVEAVHFPVKRPVYALCLRCCRKGADGCGFSPSPSQKESMAGPPRATSDAGQLITKMRRWTVAKRTEKWPYRNGTESRPLLPLWKEEEDAIRTTEPITRVLGKYLFATAGKHGKCCRCGIRISAKTLPKDTLPPACRILPDNLSVYARRAVRSPGFSPAG